MPEANGDGLEPAAGRPIWSGTVTFGLVSVPVNILPANRPDRVQFRMVAEDGTPLQRRYFSARDGKELDGGDIVRGFEVGEDKYVILEDDELERLAPEKTRDIDLRVFVKADDIDPMYFERAYYLAPAAGATKAYRLLARAMEETGRAGIATFVMRAKEYLVAIVAENGILRAETLRFADELRTAEDVGLPKRTRVATADVKRIAAQMRKLEEPNISRRELVDRSEERILAVVKKKVRRGEDVVELPEAERAEESEGVIDLMAALQRSLKGAAESEAPAAGARRKTPRKRAARARPRKRAA